VRAVLDGLHHAGLLLEYTTSLGFAENASWTKLIPRAARTEVVRRSYNLPGEMIHVRPWRELVRHLALPVRWSSVVRHEFGWASVDAVYRDLDRHVGRRLLTLSRKSGLCGVYAYEDGAVDTFTVARNLGLTRFYDLPIAYWETSQRFLAEECLRLPEWAPTMEGRRDSPEKLERKRRELELADVVFCPSDFVCRSLPAWAIEGRRVVTAPFGSPVSGGSQGRQARTAEGPLRVLFAGALTQRKGLADLFAAVKLIGAKRIELVVMGACPVPLEFYHKAGPPFTYEGPRSHKEVLSLMGTCDVFCLPSIVEGRALVVQEALSQGLPVIVTDNTGTSDMVTPGQTGFVVPIRQPHAIAEKLAWFLENRSTLGDMMVASRRRASEAGWSNYQTIIARSAVEALAVSARPRS